MTGEIVDLVAAWAGERTFCQPCFAELWRAKGGRPVAWIAHRNGEPVAALPGVEFGRAPYRRFQSMPDGGYGGVLWSPTTAPDDQAAAAMDLASAVARAGYAKAYIFDFYSSLEEAAGFCRGDAATTLVDIAGPGWNPPDRKLVAQSRKAEREGIQVTTFDWGVHAESFLALVRLTARRHGRRRPFYGERFYRRLAQLARENDRVHWLMCEHNGRPACSHIYLLEDGVLQSWQMVYDKTFSFLKPNQYICLWMCRRMARAGIVRLNLGGSPDDAFSLRSYKNRWGGGPVVYRVWERRWGLGRLR
jgi:hypothetical protein